MRIINVQGRRKTGKTTTVTKIIEELCRRGYSVGSIKSIHIEGFSMDVENEDTGKHKKAGADPVTARCNDETNIMFKGQKTIEEVIEFYNTDWLVIEGHVSIDCPNVITARSVDGDGSQEAKAFEASLAGQVDDFTICCSGVIANEVDSFDTEEGRTLPVISAVTDIEKLVDVIENQVPVIQEAEQEYNLIESNSFIKVTSDGKAQEGWDRMLNENTIDVYINGIPADSIPCTPQYLTELVLGWLNYEGYIGGMQDVQSLSISENGDRADVMLQDKRSLSQIKREVHPVQPMSWKKEWIFKLAEDFEIQLPLRQETNAAHNCRIAKGHQDGSVDILFKCEDIGRHSAIDKAVGWGMRNGVDLASCVLFTSGRVSRAMVKKAIQAGIPVMAGKGTISKKAVQLAEQNDLTLIGYSKKDSLCIFNMF